MLEPRFGHAHQVRLLERPEPRKGLARQECVDQLRAFVRGCALKELAGLVRRGNQPGEVEVQAADKRRVVTRFRREKLQFPELGVDVSVDKVRLGRRLPHEVLLVLDDREIDRLEVRQITHTDRGLPPAAAGDAAMRIDGGEIRARRFVGRDPRDVAHLAIRIMGEHAELLREVRSLQHAVGAGRDHDALALDRGEIDVGTFGNPQQQRFIRRLALTQALAADVCEFEQRFPQQQTFLRLHHVESAAESIARERAPIDGGIVAEEREGESGLPLR